MNWIPGPGITLEQLRDLVAFIDRQAGQDGFLPWCDRNGQPCHKDRINLYDVVKYVVKPATAAQECALPFSWILFPFGFNFRSGVHVSAWLAFPLERWEAIRFN